MVRGWTVRQKMMLGIHWVSASWPQYGDECAWLFEKERAASGLHPHQCRECLQKEGSNRLSAQTLRRTIAAWRRLRKESVECAGGECHKPCHSKHDLAAVAQLTLCPFPALLIEQNSGYL